MSNVQSYNALIDRFKAFASGHFILKTFSHGQIDTADLEKFTEYPFMHVVPSNVSYAKGTKTFSFQIVLADLPRDKDDKVEFQREVLSDLQRIAEDLIAEITNHRVLFGDLITVQNVSLEPFLEEFHNTLTGWTISLELLVPYYWDACSIPAEWNNYFETGTGGTGSILSFNDSIVQDGNGVVTLENDLLAPPANYYYGTNGEGIRGWYLFVDQVGLTCQTIGSCQTIIDIEAAIDLLQADMLLKANSADISAVGFSNDYNDLDNKPTIPAAQVNSDWNATSGVAEILNKPLIPSITGLVPYIGATGNVDLGNNDLYLAKVWLYDEPVDGFGSVHLTDGVFHVEDTEGHSMVTFEDGFFTIANGALIRALFNISGLTANRDYVFPNTSGTVALTSDIPAAQVNSDWNATSGVSKILNKPTLTNGTVTSVGVTAGMGISVSGSPITSSGSITVTNSAPDQVVAISAGTGIGVTGTYPNFTVTNSAPSSGGTVTSVSALTLGTTGTDLSSTVATGTTTPVITLNVPTASAANRGVLSAADWTTFNAKQSADLFTRLRNSWEASTDYISSVLNDGWINLASGLGAGVTVANFVSGSNRPGIAIATTGTTTTGRGGASYSDGNVGGGFLIANGELIFETLLMIPTLSNATERFHVFSGIIGNGTNYSNPGNAIFFHYDEGGALPNASLNWKCYTINALTRTSTVTSVAVTAGQWYKLKCVINAAATSVAFYIDGVLAATNTTNIPPATYGYGFTSAITKTAGLTARTTQIDYSAISQTLTTAR
jgi:hypothetical protein